MRPESVSIRLTDICPSRSTRRNLHLNIHAIGIASHFQLYLDSVVGNLLPPAMPFLKHHYGEKNAEIEWENMVSARIYGVGIGCLLSYILSKFIGHRKQILFGTILSIIGLFISGIIILFETPLWPVTLGRFVNGIGQGIAQTVGSVFLLEVSPLRTRGSAVAFLTFWACFGELLGTAVSLNVTLGRESLWKWGNILPLPFLAYSLIVTLFSADNPRDCFRNGNEEEARKALLFYQDNSEVQTSEEEIKGELALLSMQDENGNKVKDVCSIFYRFTDGHFVRPLLLALFVQTFVHLDDWLWISYSTPIFEKNGMSASMAQYATLIMAVPQIFVSIWCAIKFDNHNRKTLLIWPSWTSSLIAVCTAAMLIPESFTTRPTWLVIFAALDLCTAAISGESAYTVAAEMFKPEDKIRGTAIVGFVQNAFGGLLTSHILSAITEFGAPIVLLALSSFTIIYVAINQRYLPETAGKTPQEIASNFSKDLPLRNMVTRLLKLPRLIFSCIQFLVMFIVRFIRLFGKCL